MNKNVLSAARNRHSNEVLMRFQYKIACVYNKRFQTSRIQKGQIYAFLHMSKTKINNEMVRYSNVAQLVPELAWHS